jgi:deoxyribodipyrimidine photo-lyase
MADKKVQKSDDSNTQVQKSDSKKSEALKTDSKKSEALKIEGKKLEGSIIFIFRRDLRVSDNTGLINALNTGREVIPVFIFTKTQVSEENKFRSLFAINFMIESLTDLNAQLKEHYNAQLITLYGDADIPAYSEVDALDQLIKHLGKSHNVGSVYVNEDYTPYSIKRDKSIKKWCSQMNPPIEFKSFTDSILLDTQDQKAKNGNRYLNFTHFYNASRGIKIRLPRRLPLLSARPPLLSARPPLSPGSGSKIHMFKQSSIPDKWTLKKVVSRLGDELKSAYKPAVEGGRTNGIKLLKKATTIKHYEKNRNYPHLESSSATHLSAHNHFGTISIRELYWVLKKSSSNHADLIKQLYWRDFYYYIAVWFSDRLFSHEPLYNNPSTYKKIKPIKWRTDSRSKRLLNAWKTGTTGFPIVDAGMRQMLQTGYMHNRVRMIVAMMLCKIMLIDWKYGEQHFNRHLIDIDRCQNTGNWNWCASFGLDHSSYIRIFNPTEQIKKYDPECEYIKKWIPELEKAKVPTRDIIRWSRNDDMYKKYKVYVPPVLEYDISRNACLRAYKDAGIH